MSAGREGAVPAALGAVVFDMDGILIDTEPVWRRVETEVFARLGVELSDADCRETMGVRIDEAVQFWYRRDPWPGSPPAEVAHRIVAGVIDHVRAHGAPMEGALAAVATVRAAGLLCAVASSSPPQLIAAVLEKLGLLDAVDVTRSAAREARGKPAPDVYLSTARALGLPPEGCLAIEDSVNGLISARAAGMPCVVIPDALTADDPRLGQATLRLSSLNDLDALCLERVRAAYFA